MQNSSSTQNDAKAAALMEQLFKLVGSNSKGQVEGDYKDSEGLLVCHVCGKRKEMRQDIPLLGVRVHPIECDCDRKEREQREAEEQRQREQRIVDDLFSYSLVDERFRESTFDNFMLNQNNQQALTIAKNYVAKFDQMLKLNKGLLFYGDPGTGKTYLASCIANALLKKRVPLIVTSILKLTSSTGPFSREAEEQQLFLRKMNNARLLVIDDLGSERTTDYKMEQVFEVIDSRYGAKKPMIITSNLSIEQMKNDTDIRRKRIYQRILEVCYPVRFAGQSWREKSAANDYEEISKLLMT